MSSLSLSLVFTEPGRWDLWEEGRRKMRQAIKSPSMTDTDLDIGSPIYCSCQKEKHGSIISGALDLMFAVPNNFFLLVF